MNQTFILTRPIAQAKNLYAQLTALGGNCQLFPTLQINSLPFTLPSGRPEKVIFVSANAVYPVMPYWPLSANAEVFAIGPGTAKALAEFGIDASLPCAEQFTSEGLLTLPHLQAVAGQSIIIFQGQGGRPLLGEALRSRQAVVQQVAVYQRHCPSSHFTAEIPRWQEYSVLFICSSRECLENLWVMAGSQGQGWLSHQRLLVISEKMAELATVLGFRDKPLVARNASDEAILEVISKNGSHASRSA